MEKQIIIVVQATPKTQPGGVQGALLRLEYQSEVGPSFIKKLPIANPPKLMAKKMNTTEICFISFYFWILKWLFFEELYQLQDTFDHFHFC